LKININKTKIVVFKKGGKLSKYENWKLGGEDLKVANEIKYQHGDKYIGAVIRVTNRI
jgi:hypothetical protein